MKKYNYLTLDGSAKKILNNPYIIGALLKVIFPEEYYNLPLSEIVQKYLKKSSLNSSKIDTKSEEAAPNEGKQTRFDLRINSLLPSNSKIADIEIEFERNYLGNSNNREEVYESKQILDQSPKNYNDYNPVASVWIKMNPESDKRNRIFIKKLESSELVKTDNGLDLIKLEDKDLTHLGRIVEINIGGPESDNFTGIIKLIYDLFHGNKEGILNYFRNNGIDNFDIGKVYGEIMEYITLDDQVRAEAKNEGKLEGIAEGKIEGKKEGLVEGKKEGMLEQAQKTYNRLINDGFSPELAHKYAYGN